MFVYDMKEKQVNFIGRLGENEARVQRFFIGDILHEFPDASFTLLVKRPTDSDAYPTGNIEVDGNFILWTVSSGDVAYEGDGKCEVIATQNGHIVKTVIYDIRIDHALDGSGTPPDPWESWVQEVIDASDKAQEAKEFLENASAEGETLPEGSEATARYEDGVFYFGIPKGDTGNGIASAVLNADYTLTLNFTDGTSYTTAPIRGEQGETGNGIASAVLNSNYTLTLTFTDGTSYTTPSIRGMTGATPDISIGTVETGEAGGSASATMTGTPENPVLNMVIPQGIQGDDGFSPTIDVAVIDGGHRVYVTDAEGTASFDVMDGEDGEGVPEGGTSGQLLAKASDDDYDTEWIDPPVAHDPDKAPVILKSASGDLVSFDDGADNMPLKDCVVEINPVQAEGTPSPDNVLPITGWTGCNACVTGVNLFGGTLMRDGIKAALPSATIDDENKTISFVANATVAHYFTYSCGLTNKFKENTSYTIIFTIKKTSSATGSNMRVYYTDGTYDTVPGVTGGADSKETKIVVTDANKTLSTIRKTNSGGTTVVYYEESGVFEGVLTASDFVPYVGMAYPISWETEAGTVYGGSLDVVTGVLTVDRYGFTVDGDFNDMTYTSGYVRIVSPIEASTDGYTTTGKCNMYKCSNGGGNDTIMLATSTILRVYDSTITSLNDAVSKFTATPLQIVMPLAQAETYQLTPVQIFTLLGENHIWANSGDISVIYPVDTKSYVDGQGFYIKPETGIPASDLEDGVIPDISGKQDAPANAGTEGQVLGLDSNLAPVWLDQTGGGGDTSDKAPAIFKSASGEFVRFEDGADGMPVKSCVAQITAKQEMNGFYPYPAGATNNLIPDGTNTSNGYVNLRSLNVDGSIANSAYTYISEYFPVTPDTTYTLSQINTNMNISSICFYDENKEYISGVAFSRLLSQTIQTPSTAVYARCSQYRQDSWNYSGNIAQFELGSTATTPMWYSNICPIEGWTGANISRMGKNILNPNAPRSKGNFTTDDRIGTASSTYVFGIRVKQNSTYTLYTQGGGAQYRVGLTDIYPEQGVLVDYLATRSTSNSPYVINTGSHNYIALATSSSAETVANAMLIEGNNTTETVESYKGTTYSISWETEAGTVYGGSLDVTTGVLTVEGLAVTYNGSENGWYLQNSGGTNWYYENRLAYGFYPDLREISNKYPRNAIGNNTYQGFSYAGTSGYLRVRWGQEDTLENFKASLASQPLTAVGYYETPVTYQLTPTQIATLLGQNNIMADTGDIAVEYTADTKTYVDEQQVDIRSTIAPIEDGETASKAYAQGKYFFHGGSFCKAIASIASGATFTLNTNYVTTTVADELYQLNQ